MRFAVAFVIDDQQGVAGSDEFSAVAVCGQRDVAGALACIRIALCALAGRTLDVGRVAKGRQQRAVRLRCACGRGGEEECAGEGECMTFDMGRGDVSNDGSHYPLSVTAATFGRLKPRKRSRDGANSFQNVSLRGVRENMVCLGDQVAGRTP